VDPVRLVKILLTGRSEVAADAKLAGNDIFRNYPVLQLAELPSDMPAEYRLQIRTLLPYTPPNEAVANLVYASRDASGNLVHGPVAVNRPWEWVDNIGDATAVESAGDESRRRHRPSILNTSSIALELFGTRVTGEAILPRDDPAVVTNLRAFQDNTSGESIFTRAWIESRIAFEGGVGRAPMRGEEEDEVGTLPSFPAQDRRGSRRSSPAGSTLSRGSGISAPPSRFQSPFSRVSGSSDAIDVDVSAPASGSSAPGRTSKRKASVLSVSSSDIEIVDAPGPSTAAKKPRAGKAPAKTRGKKK
jgi:mediator of RNA polymerase II transcription subunit 12